MTDNEIIKTSAGGNSATAEKIKAIYPHIVVGGNIDKPYYSICYYDVEKRVWCNAYGSYNLAFVAKWLKECFEVVGTDISDFTNRLEAENSKLQAQIEALKMDNKQLKSDIILANQNYEHIKELLNVEKERRKRVTDNLKAVLIERADHSEAVKEFAKMILKKVHANHYLLSDRNNSKDYGMFTVGIEQAVNEVKKEMTGDSDESSFNFNATEMV